MLFSKGMMMHCSVLYTLKGNKDNYLAMEHQLSSVSQVLKFPKWLTQTELPTDTQWGLHNFCLKKLDTEEYIKKFSVGTSQSEVVNYFNQSRANTTKQLHSIPAKAMKSLKRRSCYGLPSL